MNLIRRIQWAMFSAVVVCWMGVEVKAQPFRPLDAWKAREMLNVEVDLDPNTKYVMHIFHTGVLGFSSSARRGSPDPQRSARVSRPRRF